MPPKRKDDDAEAPASPCAPYRLTANDIRETIFTDVAGEFECRLIVDDIIESTEEEIVRAHMDYMSIPWTIQSVLTDLFEGVHVAFTDREGGEDGKFMEEEEAASASLKFEEPLTVEPDSWSRACMLRRKVIVHSDSEQFQKKQEKDGRRYVREPGLGQTNSTLMASVDGNSPYLRQLKQRSSSVDDTAAAADKPRASSPKGVKKLKDLSGLSAVRRATRAEELDDTPRDEAFITEDDLQIAKNVKNEMQKMEDLRNISQKISKQIAEISRASASSPFVVDGATHSVVPIITPDPKSLPPSRAEMRINYLDEPQQSTGQATKSKRTLAPPPPTHSSKSKKPHHGKERALENFFEAEQQVQPMITGVVPNPGVLSKEGELVKRCDLKVPKSRMSRQEFKRAAELLSQQVPGGPDEETGASNKPPPAPTKPLKSTPIAKGDDSPVNPPMSPTSQAQQMQPSQQEQKVQKIIRPVSRASDGSEWKPQSAAVLPRTLTPLSGRRLRSRKGDSHSPNTRPVSPSRNPAASMDSRPSSRMSNTSSRRERVTRSSDEVTRDYLSSLLESSAMEESPASMA